QGTKLVGNGAAGKAEQGQSVAVSADGNTAIWGGTFDNSTLGAAWVFTRSGGTWTPQGPKLVGTGAGGNTRVSQGGSVAIPADGNTAIVGGWGDNTDVGAAWVFARRGGTWTQEGGKLTGRGATGSTPLFGWSLALSGNATRAIIGGPGDSSNLGAVW